MEKLNNEDFVKSLKDQLERKKQINPKYSLRAFSRDLGIDASNLSKIMSGKIIPRSKTKRNINIFFKTSQYPDCNFEQSKQNIKNILDLTHFSFFKGNTEWLGLVLGISSSEVNRLVQIMQESQLLKIDGQGRWQDLTKQ
jgi:hypothetical protein